MQKRLISESDLLKALKIRREILDVLEEEDIVAPRRRRGERLYSAEQLEEVIFAVDLRREMGVNWAGVEVALNMRRRMRQMSRQMEEVFDHIRKHFECEFYEDDSTE